jgi:hypothetical protein
MNDDLMSRYNIMMIATMRQPLPEPLSLRLPSEDSHGSPIIGFRFNAAKISFFSVSLHLSYEMLALHVCNLNKINLFYLSLHYL